MTDQELFMIDLINHGASAVVTQETGGTACPCVGDRGPSREWHRQNSDETDCNGTGKTGTTTTTTTVQAFFLNRLQTLSTTKFQFAKEVIGEIDKADLIMIGTVKSSDKSFFDLTDLDELRDKVTFVSQDYVLRTVYPLWTDVVQGQMGLLKRSA